jgi:hypothetical protein
MVYLAAAATAMEQLLLQSAMEQLLLQPAMGLLLLL